MKGNFMKFITKYIKRLLYYFYDVFYRRVFIRGVSHPSAQVASIGCYGLLFVLCGILLTIYRTDTAPKQLNELEIDTGILRNVYYDFRGSGGRIHIELENGKKKVYEISKSDSDIYEKLKGQKIKIYGEPSPDILGNNEILQLEDKDGKIYKEYNFDHRLLRPYLMTAQFKFFLKGVVFLLLLIFFINFSDRNLIKNNPEEGAKNE